jgi:hypothetical protein
VARAALSYSWARFWALVWVQAAVVSNGNATATHIVEHRNRLESGIDLD